MSQDEITCKQLTEVVTDYFEGTLPARQRQLLEEHLEVCPGCRNYIDQMRENIKLTGTVKQEEVPADVKTKLLEIFNQKIAGS